jgi:arginyl-tRNA synthetase
LSTSIKQYLAELDTSNSLEKFFEVETNFFVSSNNQFGDFSSNISLRVSKLLGMQPAVLAKKICDVITANKNVIRANVDGPGFINITLTPEIKAQEIIKNEISFANNELSSNIRTQKINLEFVSANPTGPIHIGGTRWAALGDSLARILEASGAEVTKEYYFNDHGAQIDRFVRTLVAAYFKQPAPDDGYGGQYIYDIVERVSTAYGHDLAGLPDAERHEVFRSVGVELMFADIKASLHDFGVDFDVFFHEDSLHESRAVDRAVDRLRKLGHIFEEDGAIWLRTTEFGDDKDRVIIKNDGQPAYIAADLAYYLDKRERGFDRNIIMLGADHHGYVARMMAMCAAFGDEPGVNLEIMIGQMVNLVKDGQPLRMSKRAGTIVTLEDLVDAVGVDAARYALVRSSSDSQLDIDLDVLSKKTNDNPVFYVQYAHARTCAVDRNAETAGVRREDGFAPELLDHEAESQLLGVLQEFPRVVAQSAELREPHRVARYIEEVAGYYHRWYDKCRVIPQANEPITDLHRTRLWLNDAAGQVIKNGLGLLGVTAPERM